MYQGMSFLRRDKYKGGEKTQENVALTDDMASEQDVNRSGYHSGRPNLFRKASATSLSPSISTMGSTNSRSGRDETHNGNSVLGKSDEGDEDIYTDSMNDSTFFNSNENYSPRSSIAMAPNTQEEAPGNQGSVSQLKENYKGFHANRRPKVLKNIPPLSHPIKPRFKRKNGSLLGKFIHSGRKDSETSKNFDQSSAQDDEISIESQNKPGFFNRTSSVDSFSLYKRNSSVASNNSGNPKSTTNHLEGMTPSRPNVRTDSTEINGSGLGNREFGPKRGNTFDLDIDLNEMSGIVKNPEVSENSSDKEIEANSSNTVQNSGEFSKPRKGSVLSKAKSHATLLPLSQMQSNNNNSNNNNTNNSVWKAPDSWDVQIDKPSLTPKTEITMSDSDSEVSESARNFVQKRGLEERRRKDTSSVSSQSSDEEYSQEISPKDIDGISLSESNHRSNFPVLFGLRHTARSITSSSGGAPNKGPNHIVRVFREDNTFTTILCPLEISAGELLNIVQRKFFLESIANYQITVYVGNWVKVLEPFEKPLKIQMGLLMLSGYTENDKFNIIGRDDLSFVCKFVVENVFLRTLTHEEEAMLSKDYVQVNISGLNLKKIPIIFHQHTYEIEKLNASNNPSIYIPLDFIQSCNNLASIDFSKNGCSKFPMNFLEAKRLAHLNMQMNCLDEIPSRISHLKNLTKLNLNSNQLCILPKSFGKLKNLVSLNLSSNFFTNYPEPVSELVNLRELDLSYNDLSYLPESIGNLSKIVKLNICTNKLSKSLPQCLTKLRSLIRLDMRYNNVSNVDVLSSLPKLEVAYASKNNISTFSDKMHSLRLLHFDRNPITNLHFENILPMLTVLDLSKAKITSFPAQFINKIPNVERLVLDKNQLVDLPNELSSLEKLVFLSLYGNNLQHIPSGIGSLTSLQYLDLHSNNLQELPDDIWNLKSLSVLNVSSNILASFPKPPLSVAKKISSSMDFKNFRNNEDYGSKLANSYQKGSDSVDGESNLRDGEKIIELSELDDEDESEIMDESESPSPDYTSQSVSLADSLLSLTIADNRLSDDCFESLSFLVQLKSLNLSYNDIIEIPEAAVRRLTRLVELYLSGNELTNLPADDLENLKSLELLFLNNNKLVSLPAELSKLTNLQHLDVGSNQLKYNISNWPYDWNWHHNTNLKYLNFSGNKRFEIKPSHMKKADTGEDYDSFLVLKKLKVLGLIDVTLTTTAVPDQSLDMRIRTTASELENIGYGVADAMGSKEHVSTRDMFVQKFRGNENEVLICSMDGINGAINDGHRISSITKSLLIPTFTKELNSLGTGEGIKDALRRTFLFLNKEINGILAAKKNNSFTTTPHLKQDFSDLNLPEDGSCGCALTLIYIKDKSVYTANVGDIEALLTRNNGDHILLTTKHDPTNRDEFERVRASGGYVSGDGALDGALRLSRGVGLFNFLPHTHSGPDFSEVSLTTADDMIVLATSVLWDFVTYELAVDILREEKDDPMLAAQKLRDYAICYGATDKIAVIVVTLGRSKYKKGSNAIYNNLGRENDFFANKRRRDRLKAGDSNLRRLEDEIDPPVGELGLVFTDIKNSTLLWDTYPIPMRSAIKIHNSIMRRQLRIVGGYEVKTEGDAFMVSFPSPTSALLWCFNVQQQLLTADWPTEILETDQCCEVTDGKGNLIFRGLSVRMGVHWGSPVCESDLITGRMDYFGPMVNRASRISAIADGGQICVSSDFLDEIKSLHKIHEKIAVNDITLNEAYDGNVIAGEIIEKELGLLEDIGSQYYDLGEKKLKGLEAPELITLAYPKKLSIRFDLFQKRMSLSEQSTSSRIIGTLPVETIYALRTVSLRLEKICSSVSGGMLQKDKLRKNMYDVSSDQVKENDLIDLLNHVVTRIESSCAILIMRQEMNSVNGGDGKIDFTSNKPLSELLDEFKALISSVKQPPANR